MRDFLNFFFKEIFMVFPFVIISKVILVLAITKWFTENLKANQPGSIAFRVFTLLHLHFPSIYPFLVLG